MKEVYEAIELDVVLFENNDIVTGSDEQPEDFQG